jgi:probable HAF family extracellular repeat protein
MTDIGGLAGLGYSSATAINDAGQVVGYSQTSPFLAPSQRAFLYENGRMVDLGTLPGDTTAQANAINSRGVIVGQSGWRAFVMQNGTMTDLNSLIPSSSDFHLSFAQYINDAGQIVAFGVDDRGVQNEYLLTPSGMPTPVDPVLFGSEVPEPSPLMFAMLAGSALAARRLCRRTARRPV